MLVPCVLYLVQYSLLIGFQCPSVETDLRMVVSSTILGFFEHMALEMSLSYFVGPLFRNVSIK